MFPNTPITGNQAAWLPYEKAPKIEVGPGPTPQPSENEVVIEVAYAAVNPTDHLIQDAPYFELEYPWISGADVSGTIVQLGSGVTRFKIGQRVIGQSDALLTRKTTNAGFQKYTTCREILVAAVPDHLPLANAVVLPLCYSTAVTGLFGILKLPFPKLEPVPIEKTVLIWGGSSTCGLCAIQLAVAAGLTVATTASPQNYELVKSLGATHVFDHNDPKVIDNILKVVKPGDLVLDCIGYGDCQDQCAEVLSKIGGGKLPTVRWPTPCKFDNVEPEIINGLDPGMGSPEIGDALWRNYLPQALAVGKFQAKPDPEILKGGLERVQDGINILRKGVSAKKIVIEIAKKA